MEISLGVEVATIDLLWEVTVAKIGQDVRMRKTTLLTKYDDLLREFPMSLVTVMKGVMREGNRGPGTLVLGIIPPPLRGRLEGDQPMQPGEGIEGLRKLLASVQKHVYLLF